MALLSVASALQKQAAITMRRSTLLLRFVVCCALATIPVAAHAAPPTALQKAAQKAARRAIVEPTYEPTELRAKIVTKPGGWQGSSFSGQSVDRTPSNPEELKAMFHGELSRLVDLDPKHSILSKAEWSNIEDHLSLPTFQVRNKDEHVEIALTDPVLRLQQTRRMVEKVRGKLAAVLTSALAGKAPTPENLALASEGLAKKFPFFESPFRVELFIGDMRGMSPKLGRWDFSTDAKESAAAYGKLPPRMQQVVKQLGQRVFAHANVMFADHMYTDALVTIDTLRALGLDTSRARFVTTPYPFDGGVRQEVEARGVQTAAAPYSIEDTKLAMKKSIGELVELSKKNGGPIVVLDDGGLASEVIAEHYPTEMHRFRIVEITKGGERLAKAALPKQLGIDRARMNGFRNLNDRELDLLKDRYLTANSWDPASREQAAQAWKRIDGYIRMPSMDRVPPQNTLAPETLGFAHYTYSDSKYKREIMTPLYTQAVNRQTFEALEHEGRTLTNKKVSIIGGGAMGLNAGLELREKGYEVTFVEPDAGRRKILEEENHFPVSDLKPALKGRGMILELSGLKNLITADHLFLMDDNTTVVHGSSKDNPFDMKAIKGLATETIPWKPSPTGQESASYVFEVAGLKRTLHFPGNGFTISHGGQKQNVPLKKYLPEVEQLVRLMAHAITNDDTSTSFPFYGTPDGLAAQGARAKALHDPAFTIK
jgi:S-adenosylhomocysteine hydrolase